MIDPDPQTASNAAIEPYAASSRGTWTLIIVAILSFILLGGAFVVEGLRSNERRDRAADREVHTVKVLYQAQRVLTALDDIETGQRGYAITGDRRFLEPYRWGRVNLERDLMQLRRLSADSDVQRANLRALDDIVERKLAFSADRVAETDAGNLAGLRAQTLAGDGRVAMERARTIMAVIIAEESRLLKIRGAVADAEVAVTRMAMLRLAALGGLLTIGLIVSFGFALRSAREARREAERNRIATAVQLGLEARVAERTQALKLADAQVRQLQKMEAVVQLTGGLAHDFNNMLAVIIGSLDLARRRLEKGGQDVMPYLGYALDGAERAAQLTNRLLAFSRQQPLLPVVTDINTLVTGLADLLGRTLGETIKLETQLDADLWMVNADRSQIENVLLNLAVNARDAVDGGGHVIIKTANIVLENDDARPEGDAMRGQFVMVAVSDDGPGMSADVLAKAIDPFFTTKPVGKGTGLGLSQVYGFARQSGGHLKISSVPGSGATVAIYLPRHEGVIVEAPRDRAIVDAMTSPRARAGESVLVVEDDDRVRAMSVAALIELGYEVITASDGVTALTLFDQNPNIALLFTDIVMPNMNGQDLARKITAVRPEIPVLYTTGYNRNADNSPLTLAPGVDFLPKPFTVTQLAGKVRETIDAAMTPAIAG